MKIIFSVNRLISQLFSIHFRSRLSSLSETKVKIKTEVIYLLNCAMYFLLITLGNDAMCTAISEQLRKMCVCLCVCVFGRGNFR